MTASPDSEDAGGVATSPQPRPCVVAAIGDSLTDARSGGGGYLRHLKERFAQSHFDNFGVGGEMVNQMRRRFQGALNGTGRGYTHVIVFGGVNDLYSDKTANRTNERIQADLGQMYDWAHAAGARVVAITVAPWGGFRRHYLPYRGANTVALNTWIHQQASAGRVDTVIDAYGLLSCGAPERLCPDYAAPFKDGLHFGREGHRRLADALARAAFSECR